MMKTVAVTIALAIVGAGSARAGGKSGTIGVGAEIDTEGLGGLSVNYDAGSFHVGGYIGYERSRALGAGMNNTDSVFEIGGRFFWHVHSTAMTDFGLGGVIGVANVPDGALAITCSQTNGPNRCTGVFVEPGLQIRAFLSSNVALSFMAGVVIGTIDANDVLITGQVQASAGVHYYFF